MRGYKCPCGEGEAGTERTGAIYKEGKFSPPAADQQVILPQRAVLIFSFKAARPTAPTTISLPTT